MDNKDYLACFMSSVFLAATILLVQFGVASLKRTVLDQGAEINALETRVLDLQHAQNAMSTKFSDENARVHEAMETLDYTVTTALHPKDHRAAHR